MRLSILAAALAALLSFPCLAEVVTYAAPDGEKLSEEYQVQADGKKVDVYAARTLDAPFAGKEWNYGGPYSFTNFDAAGKVVVKISSKKDLRNTVIRPESAGVVLHVENDHEVSITLDGPRKISVEPEGIRGPLLLFANPLETDRPQPTDANVIYFAPGIHNAGRIDVTGGKTVYLAGGAVVKGAINAAGDNIRILGRGILDSSDYEWRKGPFGATLGIQGSNIEVNGITIRGSSHWTVVPRNSRKVIVRNVKLCNSRVQNDDGINPCNSQEVLITDCFVRSDDDCVAMKGLDLKGENNVERIRVEHCIFWCDRARIVLMGHESRAAFMRDILIRDIDIIHFTMTPFLLEPGEEMRMENVRVEDIRLNGTGQRELIRLKPVVNQYMRNKVPGHVASVQFRNIQVSGKPGEYRIQLEGADEQHKVTGVSFEGVSILGKAVERTSTGVQIGKFVEDVRFGEKP